jgi:hypothetical protein
METEWYYNTNAGGWFFSSVQFEVTIVSYNTYSDYLAGNVVSTNTTTHSCIAANWSYGAYAPGVGRVYGYLLLTVAQGYYVKIVMKPKTFGSLYVPPGGNTYFSWNGVEKTILVDLTYPGDG